MVNTMAPDALVLWLGGLVVAEPATKGLTLRMQLGRRMPARVCVSEVSLRCRAGGGSFRDANSLMRPSTTSGDSASICRPSAHSQLWPV